MSSKIDELEGLTQTAMRNRARMPEVVAESRRLMHDADGEVRTAAVAIAFFAVRQVLPTLSAAKRVVLCESTASDLEAAIAAGLVGPCAVLGSALRGVLRVVRDGRGRLE